MLAAVQHHGRALEYASPELQADREVVLALVQQDGNTLWYASAELRARRGAEHSGKSLIGAGDFSL